MYLVKILVSHGGQALRTIVSQLAKVSPLGAVALSDALHLLVAAVLDAHHLKQTP